MVAILTSGALSIAGLPGIVRPVFGLGASKSRQGLQKIQGLVKVNGTRIEVGALVQPGDIVTTGPDSMAIFIINSSVYLIRENTRVDLSSETSEKFKKKIVDVLKIISGKMLSVSRGRRSIITTTAVIGIRGSGIYLEVEPERTYVCICYGVADLEAKAAPEEKETVTTTHHESPRYIYPSGFNKLIVKAPVINHTDDELIMLEELVWRQPPFVTDETNGGSYE